jgi:amidase
VAVDVPWNDDMARDWTNVCAVETALAHEGLYPERKDAYGPRFAQFIDMGRTIDPVELARSWEKRRQFNGALAAVFAGVDLLLCPSYGIATPPAERSPQERDVTGRTMRFTAPFDFSGNPTISLPCGFTSEGMPASLQLVGRHLREEDIIAAGNVYEQATTWHTMHPPLEV